MPIFTTSDPPPPPPLRPPASPPPASAKVPVPYTVLTPLHRQIWSARWLYTPRAEQNVTGAATGAQGRRSRRRHLLCRGCGGQAAHTGRAGWCCGQEHAGAGGGGNHDQRRQASWSRAVRSSARSYRSRRLRTPPRAGWVSRAAAAERHHDQQRNHKPGRGHQNLNRQPWPMQVPFSTLHYTHSHRGAPNTVT